MSLPTDWLTEEFKLFRSGYCKPLNLIIVIEERIHMPKILTIKRPLPCERKDYDELILQYVQEIEKHFYFIEELSDYVFVGHDIFSINDNTEIVRLKFCVKWHEDSSLRYSEEALNY